MNPELWQKINDIFNDAADLPAGERDVLLDEVCESPKIRREVERLLAAEKASDNFLEQPALEFNNVKFPSHIGRYRIIKELGRGGMGTVFLAERDDLGQKVALKLIKKGLDSEAVTRRFHHERKILAALEHPNIARLIDGGTTDDGLPFYVMEYIEGVPVDEYCRDKTIDEQLSLFRQICKAVAFAHQRLIVHRDLKPSNILVDTEGTAKLLDFGIAKLISNETFGEKGTATSLGMMTPNYASPEQIRGEQVTTATDIYSLGVVLYELLTGRLPFDFQGLPLDKIFGIINRTEAVKPSENPKSEIRNPKLKGDLDNIVLKALKKEPERRYQSVKDFSEDIQRHLNGLPVSARPDTFRYRAGKFVRRNTISVAAALLVFLSLIGGISATSWQTVIARRQKALAEKRFADVRNLANKVVFRYHDEIAKFPGATALREELVQDAVQYLDSLNTDEIEDVQLKLELARAYKKIGDVQGRPYAANLGKSDEALVSYQKSVDILQKASEKSPAEFELKRELVRSLLRLATLKARLNIGAIDDIQIALNLQLEVNQADNSDPVKNAFDLAEVFITQGDHGQQTTAVRIEIYLKALDLLENIPDKTQDIQHSLTRVNQRLGTNYVWLGDEFAKQGDAVRAMENYQTALPFHEKMFASVQAEIALTGGSQNLRRLEAGSYQNLSETYLKLGKKEKVLEMMNKNLEISLELARADEKNLEAQIDIANSYISLADAYDNFGDFPKALEANRQALATLEKSNVPNNKNIEIIQGITTCNHRLAVLSDKMKRPAEAANYRQKVTEMCRVAENATPCFKYGYIKE